MGIIPALLCTFSLCLAAWAIIHLLPRAFHDDTAEQVERQIAEGATAVPPSFRRCSSACCRGVHGAPSAEAMGNSQRETKAVIPPRHV